MRHNSQPGWWQALLSKLGLNRKELRAWAWYDWANSAFATTIMVAVLPLYYADVAAANLDQNLRTAYWGYTASFSLAVVALMGPLLGTFADRSHSKKKLLALFTACGVLGSCALFFVHEGDWLLASVAFVVANIGFSAGSVFYEALLPHIANEEEIHRVSTAGYAIGYIGGGVLLAINLAWIMAPDTFGFADKGSAVRWSLLSAGLWWAVFSIPIFRHVPEPMIGSVENRGSVWRQLYQSGVELVQTFHEMRRYREAFLFLLAYWAFSDGIGTIMKMGTIYGREVGIGTPDLIAAILMVQFVGIPATFGVGWLADKIGAKRTLFLTLIVYSFASLCGYGMTKSWHFWMLAGAVALVQGGAQALSRSLYALMIPPTRSAEFFGFFSFSSKMAGVIGPLAFALLSQFTGGGRSGNLIVLGLFIIGMLLLKMVDIEAGKRAVK